MSVRVPCWHSRASAPTESPWTSGRTPPRSSRPAPTAPSGTGTSTVTDASCPRSRRPCRTSSAGSAVSRPTQPLPASSWPTPRWSRSGSSRSHPGLRAPPSTADRVTPGAAAGIPTPCGTPSQPVTRSGSGMRGAKRWLRRLAHRGGGLSRRSTSARTAVTWSLPSSPAGYPSSTPSLSLRPADRCSSINPCAVSPRGRTASPLRSRDLSTPRDSGGTRARAGLSWTSSQAWSSTRATWRTTSSSSPSPPTVATPLSPAGTERYSCSTSAREGRFDLPFWATTMRSCRSPTHRTVGGSSPPVRTPTSDCGTPPPGSCWLGPRSHSG